MRLMLQAIVESENDNVTSSGRNNDTRVGIRRLWFARTRWESLSP
jgi:hypothetical protein